MKRITILGLGYIGLPTAIIAAENGYEVYGFDIDEEKIKNINEGKVNILEPEISNRLANVLASNKFKALNHLVSSDCFIIAVPTPFKEDKKADLTYVWRAGAIIAPVLEKNNLIIIESTIPVGTSDKFASILGVQSGLKPNIDFFVSHCPERVIPGKIFEELQNNDRVIGGSCEKSKELAKEFYKKFVYGNIHITNTNTAEMVKLVENASRDVQIAFAHQISAMCEKSNINPFEVIELANKHPRVNILQPSCGVGGHCIAVDPWFLIERFPAETELLKTARKINDNRPKEIINKILNFSLQFRTSKNLIPKVAVMGLSFKPDVNDLRESPALQISRELKNHNKTLELYACEPNIDRAEIESFGFKSVDFMSELEKIDILVILVKHSIFEKIPKDILATKIIFDACGFLYKSENPFINSEPIENKITNKSKTY